MSHLKASFILLQKIGKCLMLPVSVLPVAGILLGVGSAHFGWIPVPISSVMAQAGGAIFSCLPLIFAIAVAIGLTENDGVAALAATVGFMVLLATLGVLAELSGHETKMIMGMKSVETGVFGGILIGAVAAFLFKRYYRVELPSYLAFFAGKRSVPILTSLAAIAVAVVLNFVWPPVQHVITHVSHAAAYGSPAIAATVYGVVERLLIPFGLHHIWNVPFFFEIGDYVGKNGVVVHGDINRFFAGDKTAGILGGAYLFKMWGLPAAAIAIWHCARPENKVKVGSIMISAALTSFLTGITEPIEFAFLFVAPLLYVVHAFLAGAGQLIFGLLGAKLGFTFSQGFIDYVLYYPLDTKPWLVLVIGPVFGLAYYGIFRALILGLDLKTPGREDEDFAVSAASAGNQEQAVALVYAFGGKANIKSLDACITRLRVELHDIKKLQADRLKAMGASAVLIVGNGAQAIFGPRSENLKTAMEEVLKQDLPAQASPELKPESKPELPAPPRAYSNGHGTDPLTTERVVSWLTGLGGASNCVSAELCGGTRVRVVMRDSALLKPGELEGSGVQAVMKLPGQTVHLIVGDHAPDYARAFGQLLEKR